MKGPSIMNSRGVLILGNIASIITHLAREVERRVTLEGETSNPSFFRLSKVFRAGSNSVKGGKGGETDKLSTGKEGRVLGFGFDEFMKVKET